MLVVLILAFVASAMAQVPQPCAGPASFTGRFRHTDRERKFFSEGKIYYDSVNQRIREFEFEDINSDKAVYDKLRLHNLNIEYTLDLKTRKCNVTVPRRGFRPYGVPPQGKFRGSGTVGAVGVPNEQVTVNIFEGDFAPKEPFFVTVTSPDCFVVEFGAYASDFGYEHREFYDVVSGITDPMAFVPPQECISP
ncbi:hypothetical protein V1264_018637 [Littorina saxatilis]|uniref:Ependymin related protein-1 n=2 Tax=Littorina saxatilis TaxID=31220 RepID=A0AAN9BE46_9CAEN